MPGDELLKNQCSPTQLKVVLMRLHSVLLPTLILRLVRIAGQDEPGTDDPDSSHHKVAVFSIVDVFS